MYGRKMPRRETSGTTTKNEDFFLLHLDFSSQFVDGQFPAIGAFGFRTELESACAA